MEVIIIPSYPSYILYEGILNGIVTIPSFGGYQAIIKLEEKIEGVPVEIYLKGHGEICLNKGDIIKVYGRIIKEPLKFWQKDRIYIRARHIFNETLQYGY
ncbi:MAG: hypothetical protein ACFFCM_09630 [Promethearchaeota archaeon]